MASMKDIAAACNVSIATVSKALNDHSDIGEKTKEKIRQTAKELGYQPNSSARTLKTKRSYNIGVLFMDEAQSGLTHNYFSHVLNAINQEAESKGYDITFLNGSRQRKDGMTYLAHARYRALDGVIIACVDFTDPEVLELVQGELPVVTIDHVFNECISVVSNNAKGMEDLVRYVASMGHRKVAYIHSKDKSMVTKTRTSAFYRYAEKMGFYCPPEYDGEAPYLSLEDVERETNRILDLPNPPTCIFYPDDFSSMGGRNAIQSRGLKIPDDISIVGFDGLNIAKLIEPRLTTLEQNTEELGRIAASKMIDMIEKPKTTLVEMIVVNGSVAEGQTVARL